MSTPELEERGFWADHVTEEDVSEAEAMVGKYVRDELGRKWFVTSVGAKDGWPTIAGEVPVSDGAGIWARVDDVVVIELDAIRRRRWTLVAYWLGSREDGQRSAGWFIDNDTGDVFEAEGWKRHNPRRRLTGATAAAIRLFAQRELEGSSC